MPDCYAIIPHASEARLLLIEDRDGQWTLPALPVTTVSAINIAIKEQFDLTVTVLSRAYERDNGDDEEAETHRVYVLENHSPAWQPTLPARWVGQEEFASLELAIPEHLSVITAWFTELTTDQFSPLRCPWAYPGWFATAVSWLHGQLTQLAYTAAGPVEQVIVSTWSSVLRVPTTAGYLYFKASAPALAHEPLLTQALFQLWPQLLPHVLAVDSQRRWLLMQDAGMPLDTLDDLNHDIVLWEKLLTAYAHLQIAAIPHAEHLLALGCPNRRLAQLPAIFAEAIANTQLLQIDQPGGLPMAEWEQLHAMQPELQALCQQLADYAIPETLHHDDLHAGNIIVNDQHYTFFDWGESCIAHPFYTLVIVLRYAHYVLEYDQVRLDRLRNAYLAPWTIYTSMERLQEACLVAQHLGKLCRALTWYRLILHSEPTVRQQQGMSWPYWLQMFLGVEQ